MSKKEINMATLDDRYITFFCDDCHRVMEATDKEGFHLECPECGKLARIIIETENPGE